MTSKYEAPQYRFTVWRNTYGVLLQTNEVNTALREYTKQCDNVDEMFRRWRMHDIVELREMGRDVFASHVTPHYPADAYATFAVFRVHLDLHFLHLIDANPLTHPAKLLFKRSVEQFAKSTELVTFCVKNEKLTEYVQVDDLLRCVPNNVQLISPLPATNSR